MDSLVVTGATGMTGIALIQQAVDAGKRVVAIVRPNSRNVERIPSSDLIMVQECTLDQLCKMDALGIMQFIADGKSVFYHLGWGPTNRAGRLDPRKQANNIAWSLDAVSLAAQLGCSGFVGAGSQAEYGIHRSVKTAPDAPVEPNTAYGASKYAAGKLCAIAAKNARMDFAWVRIFSLYGEYEAPGTMIQSLLPKLQNDEPCKLTEGVQQWDFLNVEDAGAAFLRIGETLAGEKVYCLGSGESRPIREYVKEMRDVSGSKSELLFGAVPYEFGVPNGICADITSLVEDTGWLPRIPFAEGIRRMIDDTDYSKPKRHLY